jgi:histidine kinase/DNA gyrase B/HSP90-like ATPase
VRQPALLAGFLVLNYDEPLPRSGIAPPYLGDYHPAKFGASLLMIFEKLQSEGEPHSDVRVRISNELVQLLSDQLYQSPLKAVEELVVNAYDADAKVCRLFVPTSDELAQPTGRKFVTVFDNGSGLTASGMVDLWHVGRSNKRTEEVRKRSKRKQIGKFGIGKLATYTIAKNLTYVSKTSEGILTATLDFSRFKNDPSGGAEQPIEIPVLKLNDWTAFSQDKRVTEVLAATGITTEELTGTSWTLVLLENLKPKASAIKQGTLQWVLRTAMPLKSEFQLFLNGEEIKSAKEDYDIAAAFQVSELPPDRIKALNEQKSDGWRIEGDAAYSNTFPQGIRGSVLVTVRTLPGKKSDDLSRSNGFFIKVRGRLINQEEPFFGMTHLHYGTFNRFRADIDADDLDQILTAPREGVTLTDMRAKFEDFLVEVFQEARSRYQRYEEELSSSEQRKKEQSRSFVSSSLIEYPIAGALTQTPPQPGAEPDNSWFYLDTSSITELQSLATRLYTSPRRRFQYEYVAFGRTARLVRFDPENAKFLLNADHPFVNAHSDDPRAKLLLEDIATSEVLLEVELRLFGVAPQVIGEVLERRDQLLRALALDHPYSSPAVAKALRDAASDEHDLEIALVAAARSLGFVAKHISGDSEPDGLARFVEYPEKTILITLEAKSSKKVPSLSAIDFAGLHEHVEDKKANGCLLVAPAYPGQTQEDNAAAARARQLRISCWTIEQLSRVVEAAEARHITARQVLDIVLGSFAPADVSKSIDNLFAAPAWDNEVLGGSIIEALKFLSGRLPDSARNVDQIASVLAADERFKGIRREDVRKTISNLASASRGGLVLDGDTLVILTSYDELARRISPFTGVAGQPLRLSKLREDIGYSGSGDEEH